MKKFLITGAVIAAASGVASARSNSDFGNLAQWTFEVSQPANGGPHFAEGGIFAASSTATGATGGTYSSPVGNGSSRSFSSNGWDTGDFYEFRTSTLGYTGLTLSFDHVRSSTGPGVFDLVASTDGVNFITLVDDFSARVNSSPNWSSGGPRVTDDIFKTTLSATLDNQALLVFRIVSQVTAASTGTYRIDNVFLNGVEIPAPGAAALMGLAGLMGARRRRA
ncbi:MAG: hypothetical protein IBJ10_07040 [Phycisphaerales bacterium]|nr:hypothetical protein [Phycisphaerales bacterium]